MRYAPDGYQASSCGLLGLNTPLSWPMQELETHEIWSNGTREQEGSSKLNRRNPTASDRHRHGGREGQPGGVPGEEKDLRAAGLLRRGEIDPHQQPGRHEGHDNPLKMEREKGHDGSTAAEKRKKDRACGRMGKNFKKPDKR